MELSHNYRIGHTTVRDIIHEVCMAIWENMRQSSFPELNEERWLEIAKGFNENANYPNCVGAIDGKHIRVIKPSDSGSLYYNYKKYFSIVLLAVCDADYKFTYIDVGAFGKCSDSSIYKKSILYQKLVNKDIQIPEKRPISNNGVPMPYVIVGDEAFGLCENLMRPYGGRSLTAEKRIFNYRLSRARRYIECTFGILANKWRIFHRPLDVRQEHAIAIVQTCCVLHNYVRERDGYRFQDTLYVPPELEITSGPTNRGSRSSASYRDLFADYFINVNPLEWQNRYALE